MAIKKNSAYFLGDDDNRKVLNLTDFITTSYSISLHYFSDVASSNPLRTSQWYLDGYLTPGANQFGANVDKISVEYSGQDIKIGILDTGFDITNADLAGRFDLALSFDPRDVGHSDITPSSANDTHGTSVAGVIGANGENQLGTIGVASQAMLVGFYLRTGFGGSSLAELADLLSRQVDVDVSNNSWGYTTAFVDNFRDPILAPIKNAIIRGVTEGREGLGTNFVFAAGNDRQYIANSLNYDGDNTNNHGLTNSRFVTTVAASTSDGQIASFSTPGASILVTAPGKSIVTTTINNNDGNPHNDYAFVSGTSFAAPIVSGVIALMLEANPHLGYRDVQEILALSSRKIDPDSASWEENGTTNWNGGANLVSHDFGFGLVDAHAAVRLAETWTTSRTAANEAVISLSGNVGDGTLTDYVPSYYVTTVSADYADFSIDWVEIDISMQHSRNGDLRIELVSPTGTRSVLLDRPTGGMNTHSNLNFTFSTTHDWGESPIGDWKLIVTDLGSLGSGSLLSYELRFYGDHEGAHDVYVYTDEFEWLTGNRNTLIDASGTDTINAAATTNDLVIDLAAGGTSTVANRQVTIGTNTVIENAYGGDGHDTLTGNSANNLLSGGTGNDVLAGLTGNDTLIGGSGTDIFVFAASAGTDCIEDFVIGIDLIDLTDAFITTFDAIKNASAQVGANTVITYGTGDILTLLNVEMDQVTEDCFIFASGRASSNIVLSNDIIVADAPSGTVVGTLSTIDPDLNETFTYSLLDDFDGLFALDGRNLILTDALASTNSTSEAASTGSTFEIVVQVVDAQAHTLEKTLSISLVSLADFLSLQALNGPRTYEGGVGNNSYYVTSASDMVGETMAGGFDRIYAATSYVLPSNIEALQLLEATNALDAIGNDLDNLINGNSANNRLDGSIGADAMFGGDGNDNYFVENIADIATENANEGTDTVYTDVHFTLAANIENLVMRGDGALQGYGNELSNAIYGNSGNNTLDGGADADLMVGGDGDDSYLVDHVGDVILEHADEGSSDIVYSTASLRLGTNIENLILLGSDDLQGFGNDLANAIYGNNGSNILDGRLGADLLVGGLGYDHYYIDDAGDTIIEYSNEGTDTVYSTAHLRLTAHLENIVLQGSADLQAFGNSLSNSIYGNEGANLLDGNAGNDSMYGGKGNDTYYVDDIADVVVEDPDAGFDTIYASASLRLAPNIETLMLQGNAELQGYGNELNNAIYGNSGANLLDGGLGADSMYGGTGDDVFFVDHIGDVIVEYANEGSDTVFAAAHLALAENVERLVMQGTADLQGYGNSAMNAIYGNSGNNLLDGAAGADCLTGNAGSDTFIFHAGEATGDVVTDFSGDGDGDKFLFVGYGEDALLIQLDETRWMIEYNDGAAHDSFILSNSASIGINDYSFA